MPGALSTLGLGSQGVLTNDILDKLKDADKAATIKPIERKQTSLKLQQAGLTGLKDAMSKLSDLSTSLSDPSFYTQTKSTVSNDAVSIETSSTTKAQSFTLDVTALATRDIQKSDGFASKTDTLDAGNMHLEIDGSSYDISIEATDTLESLANKISKETEGKITGSILNVGGENPYDLILKSTNTGAQNNIKVSGDINFTKIGAGAQDASLTIDGIAVSSASNTLDDLVSGATITLEKVGESHIDITQDSEEISGKIKEFVSTYNELLDSVKTMTNYDKDTKVAGVFSGSSEIRGLMAPLKNIFDSTISSAGEMSKDFGIESDRYGKLTFNESTFRAKLEEDPKALQSFIVGEGATEGVFRKMSGALFDISTKSDGVLKTLKTNLDTKSTTLSDALEKAQKRLDAKYEIMQKRFASFDGVIGKLTNASDMLQSLIDSQNKK